MRLIDADALKQVVWEDDRINDLEYATVTILIEKQPTIGGWISVEDRLPYVDKDSGYECEVLAIVSGYDTESKCRYDHGLTLMTYSSIPELKSEWYQSDTFAPLMVHYWQSLPEPPEEDATSGNH